MNQLREFSASEKASLAALKAQDTAKANQAFQTTAPKNAISLVPGANTCEHCGKSGKLRCSACPVTDPTFYCDKECQKRDWSKHKMYCRSKQVYARTMTLHFASDLDAAVADGSMLAFKKILHDCKIDFTNLLVLWLRNVKPSQRPSTLLGGSLANRGVLKQSINDDFYRLRQTTTPELHMKRTMDLADTKYKAMEDHHEVPFIDRLCYTMDRNTGTMVRGILMSPTDYETISIGLFEQHFALGRNSCVDPWMGNLPQNDLMH